MHKRLASRITKEKNNKSNQINAKADVRVNEVIMQILYWRGNEQNFSNVEISQCNYTWLYICYYYITVGRSRHLLPMCGSCTDRPIINDN